MPISVLIIDDEDAYRLGLAQHLDWKRLGFNEPFLASDAEEAYKIADTNDLDVVLADVNLQGITGIEIVRNLKAARPGLCSLMISGHDDFEYVQESMEAGANGYVLKPVDLSQVENWLLRFKAELEIREKILARDQTLLHQVDENLQQARRLFLCSIINEAWISENELRETSQQLNLPGFDPPWLVFALSASLPSIQSASSKNVNPPVILRLVSACETYLAEAGLVISLSTSPHEAIILFTPRQSIQGQEDLLKESLTSSLGNFANEMSLHVLISDPLKSWNDLKIAHKNLFPALRNLAGSANSFVLFYQELSIKNETLQSEMDIFGEQILSSLQYGSLSQLEEILSNLQEFFVKNNNTSFLAKQAFIVHIFSSILRIHEETFLGQKLDTVKLYTNLLSQSDSKDLVEVFIPKVMDLAEQLQAQTRNRKNQTIETVIHLLEHHYKEDLTLNDLAESVMHNPSYLSVLFKNVTGKTISEYLLTLRLDKAKALLRDSNLKVYEIAGAVGFKTIAYFTSVFKKSLGLTPGEFRKNSRD